MSTGRRGSRALPPTASPRAWRRGEIAVVPGFQGVEPGRQRIATLGRGGSDTTAVALAIALQAECCDIYTDVEGVHTADPRRVKNARALPELTFEEMLELSALGAKVLQARAAELAAREGLRLRILSAFNDHPGTLLVSEDNAMEKPLVRGLAHSDTEARITLRGVPDKPGAARAVFRALDDAGILVDIIVQSADAAGDERDITFTLPRGRLDDAKAALAALDPAFAPREATYDDRIAKISAVGVGMRSHAGVARRLFDALADGGVNIEAISTSEIRLSVLIAEADLARALQLLHDAFGLEGAREEPTFPAASAAPAA